MAQEKREPRPARGAAPKDDAQLCDGERHRYSSTRFQTQVRHLRSLGPRAVGELLLLLALCAANAGRWADADRLLAEFARVSPALVRAVGAYDFPRLPLIAIDGDRR